MTQDERWLARYNEVKDFIETRNQGDRNFYTQDIPSYFLKQIA